MGNLNLPHDKNKHYHHHEKKNEKHLTHHHDGYSDGKHFHLYDKEHGDPGEVEHPHGKHGTGNLHSSAVPVDVEAIEMEDTADPTIYADHGKHHEYLGDRNEAKHQVFGVFLLIVIGCIILVIVFA